jgi:Ca2+-binding RTX toxin-like protein
LYGFSGTFRDDGNGSSHPIAINIGLLRDDPESPYSHDNIYAELGGKGLIVNSTTAGSQYGLQAVRLSNGSIFVCWTDDRPFKPNDPIFSTVSGRLLGSDGVPTTEEFRINATAEGSHNLEHVRTLLNGGFMTFWVGSGGGPGYDLRANVFNADGTRLGEEINVNDGASGNPRGVKFRDLDSGRFMAIWSDGSQAGGDASGRSVKAQIFDAEGGQEGNDFLVNTTTEGDQSVFAIDERPGGGFAVRYWDNMQKMPGIYLQMFDDRGNAEGTEIHIPKGFVWGGWSSRFCFYVNEYAAGENADGVRGQITFTVSYTLEDVSSVSIDGGGSIIGTSQNDSFVVDQAGTTVVELADQGYDTVTSGVCAVALSDNVEAGALTGGLGLALTGNGLDNRLVGNLGGNAISGLDGYDRIKGGGGDDVIDGGAGADRIDGGAGADAMAGGDGADAVYYTRAGAAAINLATGIHGGSAAGDSFASIEKFFGSNAEGDTMTAGAGAISFNGQGGDDLLLGGDGNDRLTGGAGRDCLLGGAGRDTLEGGADQDIMTGGAGGDVFLYARADFGRDMIRDFQDGLDLLKVSSAVADSFDDFVLFGNGTNYVTMAVQMGEPLGVIILHSGSDDIPITITAADFLFY